MLTLIGLEGVIRLKVATGRVPGHLQPEYRRLDIPNPKTNKQRNVRKSVVRIKTLNLDLRALTDLFWR